MLYEDTVEDTAMPEEGKPSSPPSTIISRSLARVVGSWTLPAEVREDYEGKVLPLLQLIDFDSAMATTPIPSLPPMVRVIAGIGIMVGVAVVMRRGVKGRKDENERSQEYPRGRGTGDGKVDSTRDIFEEPTVERTVPPDFEFLRSRYPPSTTTKEGQGEEPRSGEEGQPSDVVGGSPLDTGERSVVSDSDGSSGQGDTGTGG